MPAAETPQQYTSRMLSNIGEVDPWSILESTSSRLRQLVSGHTADALSQKPAPGRWSVSEILAHLADAELVGAWRYRSILASSGNQVQPFDQDRWAEAFNYQSAPVSESLDLFETTRRANLRLLRSVDPALHENYGMHQERGRESVAHLIRMYAGHDVNHLRQIERLLGG
jgi:hypothetical protein